ncbi:MAG: hypothetical protein ACRCXB_25235 [Aeromonadaceae bacterium]
MPYEIKFIKDGKRKSVYVLAASTAIEAVQKAESKLEGVEIILSVKPLPIEQ